MRSGLILFFLSTTFISTCESITCEKPWRSFHRNCILFVKDQMLSWFDAQKKCEEQGANLISINSFIEGRKLLVGLSRRIKKPNELYWWVGLRLNQTTARWTWTDGDYLSPTAIGWKAGEPDNRSGKEYCVDFHFSGKLSDKDCSETKPYVCERIKITPAPTSTTMSFRKTKRVTTTMTTAKSATPPLTTATSSKYSTVHTMTSSETTTPQTKTSTVKSKVSVATTKHTESIAVLKTTDRPSQNIKSTKISSDSIGKEQTYKRTSTSSTVTVRADSYKYDSESGCPEVNVYGVLWLYTKTATTVKQQCSSGSGFASWKCQPQKGWVGQPDMSKCASSNIQRINRMAVDVITNKEVPTVDDIISVAANLTETVVSSSDMSAADISTSTFILHQAVRGKPETVWETETILKEVVKAGTYIFSKTETSEKINAEGKERASSELLHVVEHTTQSLVNSLQTAAAITTKTEKIDLSIKVFNVTAYPKDLQYDTAEDGTHFFIPNAVLQKQKRDGYIKAVFMTHYGLGKLLPVHRDNNDVEVGSDIITASIGTDNMIQLPSPVVFTIRLSKVYGKGSQPYCSFWDFSKGEYGKWSQEGCNFIVGNATHVTCECNHLTNFAILMDVSGVQLSKDHAQFLKYMTYIGCIISITCLGLSWITFQCLRSLDSERNSIHKNLVFCLFVAESIFIVGIDRTDDKVACAAIALLLHFFFLSSFTWMFLEGVHIVILLRQVFDTAKPNLKYYYLIGYGVPITIVGTTAGIDFTAYGTSEYCWLTTARWFIWSFTGPVAVILIINTIVLMYAMSMVCRHAEFIFSRDRSREENFRTWIQGALAIEVLLGSTWVFGYFFINETTVVMAYIFTILNSLQGLFIFTFHCLLNKKIRFEYKKLAHVRHNSQSSTKSASFKKKEGSYEVYVSN